MHGLVDEREALGSLLTLSLIGVFVQMMYLNSENGGGLPSARQGDYH